MNSPVINSSRPFNHSSSGSSSQNVDIFTPCIYHPFEVVFLFIEKCNSLVVGYPANIMVMWLVAREKSDSSTSNYFIFSLALADAWFCVTLPITSLSHIILEIGYFRYINWFTTGIKNSSPLFLACICLDRYVAVVHPVVFTSIKDKKIRVAISMLAWGLVIAYALCRTVLIEKSNLQHHIYIGLILAAFTIMVYCNVSIIWSLRKSVLGKEKINPMKKKALRTVQIYLGIIVFHYLPTVVISVAHLFFFKIPIITFCTIESILFTLLGYSAITHPFLYMIQIKQLPWLKKLLCICCRSPSPEPHNVSP